MLLAYRSTSCCITGDTFAAPQYSRWALREKKVSRNNNMRKMRFVNSTVIFLIGLTCIAQTIPIDSLHLGQIPPDDIPIKFNLYVTPIFAAVEKVLIQ